MNKRKALSLFLVLVLAFSLVLPATTALAADDTNDTNDGGDKTKGMNISKTASYNEDTQDYTITLEAFATGEKITTVVNQDVPTDVILVLDQSGSMSESFTTTTEDSWTSYGKQQNSVNYDLRMNDWYTTGNLYYKLPDGGYVEVSVDRTSETVQDYVEYTNARNQSCYSSRDTLYAYTDEGYKVVTVTRSGGGGGNNRTYTYTYTLNDGTSVTRTSTGNQGNPPYTIYRLQDTYEYTYRYYYTVNNVDTEIGIFSKGADTVFDVEFFKKMPAGTTLSKLEALQSAVGSFADEVSKKAKGPDGIYGTADDVNHRIAVVGYATGNRSSTGYPAYENTGVFIGSTQYNYNVDASSYYGSAFQDMNTQTGHDNVIASKNALAARGATYTNLGIEMANGIFAAYPIPADTQRNRVVIVFTDGIPGWNGYDDTVANDAITKADTTKAKPPAGYGATVYTIGIFDGADATSAGDANGNETEKANYFMQQVSTGNGAANSGYYLSSGDHSSLMGIFKQISDNIEDGGSSTTLDDKTIVNDIISPYFKLPEGTTLADIRIDTYDCLGKTGDTYSWSSTSGGSGGATADISTDGQVKVTGFNFSENWCGIDKAADGTETIRGKKLVISFEVVPKAGFLGGNSVDTNGGAYIYENGEAQTPLMEFEKPIVNVPIPDAEVTAAEKNVYLLDSVTADQLKSGAGITFGNNVTLDLTKDNYGLETWQTEYVNIAVEVLDKDGSVITDLSNLTEDTTYKVKVTVTPKDTDPDKTTDIGPKAETTSQTAEGKINVFKPELTYKDSDVYYGAAAPELGSHLTDTKWKHGETLSTDVTMVTETAPVLVPSYAPDADKIVDGKVNTKQDIAVDVTVKIGERDVTSDTVFVHTDCEGKTCTVPAGKEFVLHVKTCTLTVKKTGGAAHESYVFDVYKDGVKYSEVSIWENGTATLVELPVGTYTIAENTGWSWRFTANNGGEAKLSADQPTGEITCTNTPNGSNKWLNGFSTIVENIFGKTHEPTTDTGNN